MTHSWVPGIRVCTSGGGREYYSFSHTFHVKAALVLFTHVNHTPIHAYTLGSHSSFMPLLSAPKKHSSPGWQQRRSALTLADTPVLADSCTENRQPFILQILQTRSQSELILEILQISLPMASSWFGVRVLACESLGISVEWASVSWAQSPEGSLNWSLVSGGCLFCDLHAEDIDGSRLPVPQLLTTCSWKSSRASPWKEPFTLRRKSFGWCFGS